MTPVPAREMSEEDYEDFVSEMCWAVIEQGHLFGLAYGAIDPGKVHGPWDPHDCSLILTDWLDTGWLHLRASKDDDVRRLDQRLAHVEAREVLADPGAWVQPDRTTAAYELEFTHKGFDVFTHAPYWAIPPRPPS